MPHLILVSFIWAFSFGLTKGKLAGLDSAFISAARLVLALIVFLPFLRLSLVTTRIAWRLVGIGALQFGVMYLAYNESFRHLAAYEVALFTLTTPIFVTLFADALERTLRPRALAAALLAVVAGGFVVSRSTAIETTLTGLLLVQVSNLAFALGQVLYRRERIAQSTLHDRHVFALLYIGAVALTVPVSLARTGFSLPALTGTHVMTLAYLGILSSGLCFFWWNLGALRVNAGTLAVFNNAKIPLAVACSLLFFGETAALPQLALGGALLVAALAVAETPGRRDAPVPLGKTRP